jgi:hypothetical protein
VEHHEGAQRRDDSKCDKLETRLRAVEDKVAQRDALIERLDADFYNHGRDGMKTAFGNFITETRTEQRIEKEQRDREHESNTTKLNLLMVIATAGLLLIGAVGLFITYETSKHSQLDPAKIFHSQSADPVLSYWHNQQSTSIPTLR